MGQEVKNPLRAQSKYGLMGSSAKTGKNFFEGHRSTFCIKMPFGIDTPHLYINYSLHVCRRVQGSQIFKQNSIISIRSKVMAFLVISLSPWSPRCPRGPHVVPVIPVLSLSSPCHPHSPQKVPMWSPWSVVSMVSVVSVVSTCHPRGLRGLHMLSHGPHIVPVIPTSSPCHPRCPHVIPIAPRRSPCGPHGLWSPWSPSSLWSPHVVPVVSMGGARSNH